MQTLAVTGTMFRILLFSAFGLLLAAVGKFLFMDDYLTADARRVAVSAASASAGGLADEHRRSADLFASAYSGTQVDSLFEDVLPADGAAANLGGGGRAIARDLLGNGVVEPQGPAALPSADEGATAQQASSEEKASETASEPQAREPVTVAALPPLPPSVAAQSAVIDPPVAKDPPASSADADVAPPPAALVEKPQERPTDVRRVEGKPQVATAAAPSSATSRKPSKEAVREQKAVEKRPAPAAVARSQAPKEVAKAERSKPVVARNTPAPRRDAQPAGRAVTAQSKKAAGTYQARVSVPAGSGNDRRLLARLEQETRPAPTRPKSEPANRGTAANAATAGGMARSTSGVNGDEMVSRWVGSVASGVQRLMGHELNSVSSPRSVVSYCRSQPESWVYDEGRKQMVYCGEVAAVRSSAAR
ncbi:hypothetical protein DF3PA_30102 [Candidatus Defluviicoccus seviourii]|uniref:Uncharacterized protein n=1 Tax=Candidatus Defluviicoccus seviourii TaxID=2565273 RepID=A0A564WH49_9PROT|nr:hypothetical protein DF3PA_30102 [Candidatus Defluviicoccus seviourii]